jgi:hypothetical protein
MTSGIYDENLVAHVETFDGDAPFAEARLISVNAGPAGHASISLSDGLEIEVDFAEPSLMTVISLITPVLTQLDQGITSADGVMLGELIGDERAEQVLQAVADAPDAPVRIESINERRRMTTAPTRASRDAQSLGRAVGLLDIATDRREIPAVRVIAAIEAVSSARGLRTSSLQQAFIGRSQNALISLDEQDSRTLDDLSSLRDDLRELAETDPKITFMVRDLVRRELPRLSGPAAGIAEYVAQVLEGDAHIDGDDDVHAAVDRWRVSQQPVFSMRTVETERFDVEQLAAPMLRGRRRGRWIRIWDENPGGSWVRILDPDDQVLVALVPVRAVDGGWQAEAIVPTTRDVDDWLIEVTDTPLPPTKTTSSDRIIDAVRLGRIATQLSARGAGRDRAVEGAWLACAEAWKEAGDPAREARARQLAERPVVERPVFLADRVRETLWLTPP